MYFWLILLGKEQARKVKMNFLSADDIKKLKFIEFGFFYWLVEEKFYLASLSSNFQLSQVNFVAWNERCNDVFVNPR